MYKNLTIKSTSLKLKELYAQPWDIAQTKERLKRSIWERGKLYNF